MTSGNAGSGTGGGEGEQELGGSAERFEQLSKEEMIKKLSGGAGIDPMTKTVGGPDSPSGVSLTEGGAVGTPLAYQQDNEEEEGSGGEQEGQAGQQGQDLRRSA
jgi:hypothetical protein